MPFISFSCFIGLTRTSRRTLNKNGENGHPCLVSNGKLFSLSPLGIMSAIGFLADSGLRKFPCIPIILRFFFFFLSRMDGEFCHNAASASIVIMPFSPLDSCMVDYSDGFFNIEPDFFPGISLMVAIVISFYTLVTSIC